MTAIIVCGTMSVLPKNSSYTQSDVYAVSQTDVSIDKNLIGKWAFFEYGDFYLAEFRNDGVIEMVIGDEMDYLLSNSYLHGENYYSAKNGIFYIYHTADRDEIKTEVTYTISNNTLTTEANDEILVFSRYLGTLTTELGDVNGDNSVNAVDASFALSIYAAESVGSNVLISDSQKTTADVNSDGAINAVDASIILSYYAYSSTGGTASLNEFINM